MVDSSGFVFEARTAFLAISCFAGAWVYLILRRLFPGRALAHLAGAAYVTTSWEVGYHSRFIAVDAAMMQLVALTFLCIIIAQQRQDRARVLGWLGAAALCAAATAGSKYPGFFLLAPILAAVWMHPARGFDRRSRALVATGVMVIFVITFVLSTPGSLYDPIQFAAAIIYQASLYNLKPPSNPYYVYPVAHLRLALLWLYGVVPSPWIAVSALLSMVTAVGYWTLWRQHRPLLLCLVAFALPHSLFVAINHFLVVRNWILYVPLIAIAFGAGVVTCYDFARRYALGWIVPSAISAIFLCNIGWLWIAANSIRQRNPEIFASRLLDYMRGQAGRDFRVSPKLIKIYNLAPRLICSDAEFSPSDPSAAIVFLALEQRWVANRPGFVERTISTNEVNYDYYPNWLGHQADHRIVILRKDRAIRMGVESKDFLHCTVPRSEAPTK